MLNFNAMKYKKLIPLAIGFFASIGSMFIYTQSNFLERPFQPTFSTPFSQVAAAFPALASFGLFALVFCLMAWLFSLGSSPLLGTLGAVAFLYCGVVLRIFVSSLTWDFFSKFWFLAALALSIVALSPLHMLKFIRKVENHVQYWILILSCLLFSNVVLFAWWIWRASPLNPQNSVQPIDVVVLVLIILFATTLALFAFYLSSMALRRTRQGSSYGEADRLSFSIIFLSVLLCVALELNFGRSLTGFITPLLALLLVFLSMKLPNPTSNVRRIILATASSSLALTSFLAATFRGQESLVAGWEFYFLASLSDQARFLLSGRHDDFSLVMGAGDVGLLTFLSRSEGMGYLSGIPLVIWSFVALSQYYFDKATFFFQYATLPYAFGDDIGSSAPIQYLFAHHSTMAFTLLILFLVAILYGGLYMFHRYPYMALMAASIVFASFLIFLLTRYSIHQWWFMGMIGTWSVVFLLGKVALIRDVRMWKS